MKEQKITVVVDANGDISMEVEGFSDGKCLKETEAIENALGKVTTRARTNHGGTSTSATVKTGKA